MALTTKEVIQSARVQFKEFLPDLALDRSHAYVPPAPKKGILPPPRFDPTDIRLEELEREGENWAVTLSVPNPDFKQGDLLEGIRQARSLARVAKVFVIDGVTGNLIALRDRDRERAA